ncbi:MAG: hypothetical protein HY078_03470 [Elusimicrobia bacterium]|nr:hypothetical protein [Elusimicrobiota bacterium]
MKARRTAVASAWGALGGGLGAYLGYGAVALAHREAAGADFWLKGAHGPPFFDLTLSTAVYYACLGAALAKGRRRVHGAGLGIACVVLTVAAPLSVATRVFSWGETGEPTLAWYYLILWSYRAANVAAVAAVAAIGAFRDRDASRRGAVGALLGQAAAFLVENVLFWAVPGYAAQGVHGAIPLSALVSGVLWGVFISAGASLLREDQAAPAGPKT